MHSLFKEVAEAVSLREGPLGVERFFWTVAQGAANTSRDVARELGLPIPVVAAIRREFEKSGLLTRDKGISLTDRGKKTAESLWGNAFSAPGRCGRCKGTGLDLPEPDENTTEILGSLLSRRPGPEFSLDQAHMSLSGIYRKALFFISRGFISGNRILFIGDDDFLSAVVLIALRERFGVEALRQTQIQVIEIDARIVSELQRVANELNLPLSVSEGDARNPLSEEYRSQFDVAVIDPPYTLDGLGLFLDRCVEGLTNDGGRAILLSFGRRSPAERGRVFSAILNRNLVPRTWLESFNEYEGAAVLGGRSDLFILEPLHPVEEAPPKTTGLYTAQHGKAGRAYKCAQCGGRITVGPSNRFRTIGQLKTEGCPSCGGEKFRYAAEAE